MTTEIWKPIPGYPDYEVSNRGRVISHKHSKSRLLKPSIGKYGHLQHSLHGNDSRPITQGVHRLVMLAFVGPCPEGMEVCHQDNNPQNNRLDNLRYDTHKMNGLDSHIYRKLYRKMLLGEILIGQVAQEEAHQVVGDKLTPKSPPKPRLLTWHGDELVDLAQIIANL